MLACVYVRCSFLAGRGFSELWVWFILILKLSCSCFTSCCNWIGQIKVVVGWLLVYMNKALVVHFNGYWVQLAVQGRRKSMCIGLIPVFCFYFHGMATAVELGDRSVIWLFLLDRGKLFRLNCQSCIELLGVINKAGLILCCYITS